ncbi:MAG: B12-binding domain-containing radical SAM protein [Microvirga sp.]
MMQPISGLHVASLIDQRLFDVSLYHEDWHGPFDPGACAGYDLVFLTGLQPDFDRMRQLAYFFRRGGAIVVAGGSICTSFPEFATHFFDVVCAGGVECAAAVIADYERGSLKRVYRSPIGQIGHYTVDYGHFTRSGISPSVHLIEASRGCSFRCSFCSIPSEVGVHAKYDLSTLATSLDGALAAAPLLSFRRWYPLVLMMDNNFSDDRAYMLAVAELMRSHRKIRGWAALVTQNVINDRGLMLRLAAAKCIGLFVGLESLDRAMLQRFKKTQNLGRNQNVTEDIAFAESLGIAISYGFLFDPCHQTAAHMDRQIREIARNPLMPMPTYLSVVAPLAGTTAFWADLEARRLAPNLRLRDLDGETLAYSAMADDPQALAAFVEKIFRRPWEVADRIGILFKTLRRILRSGTINPIRWYVIASANLHCFLWSRAEISAPRTYRAGTDTLDPQYFEQPDDLSEADRRRYFDPIALTDAHGGPVEWLVPYRDKQRRAATKRRKTVMPVGVDA